MRYHAAVRGVKFSPRFCASKHTTKYSAIFAVVVIDQRKHHGQCVLLPTVGALPAGELRMAAPRVLS